MIRIISETHGLLWTGEDQGEAEEIALMAAVNTARTVYLLDGENPDPPKLSPLEAAGMPRSIAKHLRFLEH